MKVYKFGGASVKDAEGIRRVTQLLKNESIEELVIVICNRNSIQAQTPKIFFSIMSF